jgi:hypothetical protein
MKGSLMRSRKILLLILLSFTLTTGCDLKQEDRQYSAENSGTDYPYLTLELVLDKDVYQRGEPISARLILTNIGEQRVVVNQRMISNFLQAPDQFRDVSFLIISPADQSVPWGVRKDVEFPKTTDFVTLSPGAEIEATYDLQSDYIIPRVSGRYIVIAYYKNTSDPDDNRVAWKGELTSNLVVIIIEP